MLVTPIDHLAHPLGVANAQIVLGPNGEDGTENASQFLVRKKFHYRLFVYFTAMSNCKNFNRQAAWPGRNAAGVAVRASKCAVTLPTVNKRPCVRFFVLVSREGFEPSTHGLKGRCSTS